MAAGSRRARWVALAAVVLAVMAFSAAGCGSSSSSSSNGASSAQTQQTHFAKTKFALHAGLAFGAFHRYIYKPYKAHTLTHRFALLKASLAAAFAYHETRLALNDARSSKILSTLLAPVLAVQNKFRSLSSSLRGGHLDGSQIQAANGDASSISAQSAKDGQPVQDQKTPSF